MFTITEGGYAKRTAIEDYRVQGRGGLGIKVMKQSEERGQIAGAMLVAEDDEVLVILNSGKVVRSDVAEVPAKGRDTMGVVFARHADSDFIIGMARNTERELGEDDESAADSDAADSPETDDSATTSEANDGAQPSADADDADDQ